MTTPTGMQGTADAYVTDEAHGENWTLLLGDSCERLAEIPDDSIGLSVCSPPFASLYTYSPSIRDLGNCSTRGEFLDHYGFIIREQLRVTQPGRNACVHVAQVTTRKNTEGFIGLTDFRGEVIRAFQDAGWIFFGEVTVWKNPQAQATRTKAHSLMFTSKNRDSARVRPALADYLLIFKKPGDNAVPIPHDAATGEVTNDDWIEWASPIWYDARDGGGLGGDHLSPAWTTIRETNTLNERVAREDADERHLCLAAGTLVLTRDGYAPIEAVQVGDRVLTHTGRWQRVTAKACNGMRPVVRVHAQGVADLRATPDHPLWTRPVRGMRAKESALRADPAWVEAADTLGSYVNLPLPPVEENPIGEDDWWIIGRWLGDGHRGGHGDRTFYISCSYQELDELLSRLGTRAGHVFRNRTACQVAIRDEEGGFLKAVLKGCGSGAASKKIPALALALCPEKAEALLSGYLSADGHYVARYDRWMASSVSRALLLSMALVAQRARGVVASVYAGRPPRKHVIEGRVVEAKQDWIFSFRNSDGYRKSGWIDDSGAWKKVRTIQEMDAAEVWDLQVAGDESMVAEGCVVHNCPLQLDFIERCVRLWSNQGETVLDPFGGIGSTGVVAVQHGRRSIAIELKASYWRTAVQNMQEAERSLSVATLFDEMPSSQPVTG